jgi:hypothetical protein
VDMRRGQGSRQKVEGECGSTCSRLCVDMRRGQRTRQMGQYVQQALRGYEKRSEVKANGAIRAAGFAWI